MKLTNFFLNFDFNGRARRAHYWANVGCWLAVVLVVLMIAGAASGSGVGPDGGLGVVLGLILIAAIPLSAIDAIAMVFRRAHDTGKSGWIWLLLLIPFVNLLALYWLMIEDSHQGPNKYGPPVKQFYEPTAGAV